MKPYKLIVLMSTSCLMLAGAAAQAQGHGGHHRGERAGGQGGGAAMRAVMMLRAADANGDNSITRAEVDTLQGEMFAWMDRNGDGYLDEADQSPVRQRLRAIHEAEAEDGEGGERHGMRGRGRRGGEGRRGERGDGRGGEGPGRFDADEDGRISRAEFLGGEHRLFQMLDADEDGVITPDELDAASEQRQERREGRRQWWRN